MKAIFLSRRAWPEIGGVEIHIRELIKKLEGKGISVRIISGQDIKYPQVKFIGLIFIWLWLLKNRKYIEQADIVHCHDVFIWYLPFRFLYPRKKVITTIHGLEWDNPLNPISLWQKRLATRLSDGTIGVGKFLEKYLNVEFDLLIYGAASKVKTKIDKKKRGIVYVGRLEENTGLRVFLNEIKHNNEKIDFVGDGRLRKECEKYGLVHGFADPNPFYKKTKYCVPGGYLAALEGLSYGCELKLYWNNQVKKDYWQLSPFVRKDVNQWAKSLTWEKLADEHIRLYKSVS